MKERLRAVFIDRDGVLIREADYLGSVAGLLVLKGAPEALKRLKWDALYFPPHGPGSKSPMRKPGTGMLIAATAAIARNSRRRAGS